MMNSGKFRFGILFGTSLLSACVAFGAAEDNPVLRIMPLGDSITHGSKSVRGNGYRAPLYVALTNLGYNVDYVGTVDFTFNQKVTAASACDAANWTVTGTAETSR